MNLTLVSLGNVNLKNIKCLEYECTVSNDCVVRYEKRLFQILKTKKPLPKPKDKVTIQITFDGKITVLWKNTKLLVKELTNIKNQQIRKAA
jgi:predicted component of type VI protein secretion system